MSVSPGLVPTTQHRAGAGARASRTARPRPAHAGRPCPPASAPGLRRLPAPDPEPPYDDERPTEPTAQPLAAAVGRQGTLALSFPAPALRLVRPIPDEEFGPRSTQRRPLPAPRPFAGQLVQATLEVLAGTRPLSQLLRWTSPELYAQLERCLRRRPTLPTARRSPGAVRSVHVSEVVDGIVEACAVVRCGARAKAVALRLEGVDGRWCCTALQIG